MRDKTYTAQDLLMKMLSDGWTWENSDERGFVLIRRDDFKYLMEPFNLCMENILQMHFLYGKHVGKILGKNELEK